MKRIVKLLLLFFWFTAIIAPSVITIVDWDTGLIVNTMSEEEQKEQEKKDPTEENIVQENLTDFTLISLSNNLNISDFDSIDYGDYTVEILLPPPEFTV